MTDEQTSVKDMKTITFEGKEYEVPVWVKWVAKDGNGRVYGYQEMPEIRMAEYGGLWSAINWYTINGESDWKNSLIEV